MSPLEEPLEFVILVTHGFFTQKIPTLFGGKGGYADYCSCSCIEVSENSEGKPQSSLYFDTQSTWSTQLN